MHDTINSNDASNERLTRLRNIVWLWCISAGYEDVSLRKASVSPKIKRQPLLF